MSGHEGASFCLHISPSAFASRTQSGGTTDGPARLVREDQNVVSDQRAPCGFGRPGRDGGAGHPIRTALDLASPHDDSGAGGIVRTTVTLSDDLIASAQELTGITERTELLRAGLETLVRVESARRLAALGGSDRTASAAPRRRSASQ